MDRSFILKIGPHVIHVLALNVRKTNRFELMTIQQRNNNGKQNTKNVIRIETYLLPIALFLSIGAANTFQVLTSPP